MEYIPHITSIIIGLVTLYLCNYLKKSADNAATKKDIEEITKKIETVKAKLQIDTKGAIDFKTNRRQTILEFYDAFIFWYDVVLDLANSNLDEDHLIELKNYENKIDNAYSQLTIKNRRLNVYVSEDTELINLTTEMVSLGIKLEGFVRTFVIEVYPYFEDLNEYESMFRSGVNVNHESINKIHKQIEQLENKLEKDEEKIREKIDEKLKSFIDIIKNYIKIDI